MKSKPTDRQAGRQTKKPTREFKPEWFGWDLLASKCRKAMRKAKAAKYLDDRIEFLFRCAVQKIDCAYGATNEEQFAQKVLENIRALVGISERQKPGWIRASHNPVMNAIRFAQLYSKGPDAFLRCMTELRRVVNRANKSRRFRVAWRLAIFPQDWLRKTDELSLDYTDLSDFKVSPKLIEKARSFVRTSGRGF